MSKLNLSVDEVLTTTRAVRKRLDLNRPVELEIIRECLELALQAPTPGGMQNWHFIVVTDPEKRLALADIYRKSTRAPGGQEDMLRQMIPNAADEQEAAALTKIAQTPFYLTENLHRVPVHVIPCLEGRAENLTGAAQSGYWGGIWPAMWSFMLAARSRGLGTVPTTLHLDFEREAAAVLGIPYETVTQAGLIPVAYTIGTDFKPAARKPLESVLHSDHW
jgi:nitroreductase